MKTIRKGRTNPDKPWVGKKIDCSNCDFSGKLESGDKVKFVADQRDGDYYSVKCPNCKAFMNFAASLCS